MAEASAATARQVIYSSYVVPQEVLVLEEGDATTGQLKKYAIETGCGRTFGGKGTVPITADQWGESWTSMQHAQQYWEQYSSFWEDSMEIWNNVGITISGATPLVLTSAGVDTTVVEFLYIKNLGTDSDQGLKVSLDDGYNYKILIPPQGSIALRGDGTTLQMEDVKVDRVTSNTTIEFIIAHTPA